MPLMMVTGRLRLGGLSAQILNIGPQVPVDLEGQVDSNVKGEVEHKGKVKAVLPDGISEEVVAEFGLFIAKRGATGSAVDSESEDDREV